MKKLVTFSLILVTLTQGIFAQTNKILTELITYRVSLKLDGYLDTITFKDPASVYAQMNDMWYANKLGPVSYQTFVTNLHNAAAAGKLQVFDPMFSIEGTKPIFMKMTAQEVASIGVDSIRFTTQRPYPPYEIYDTTFVNMLDPTVITQIEFMEKWTINTKTKRIKKEIIAYAPWRIRVDPVTGDLRGLSRMYWVLCKNKYTSHKYRP